MDQIKIGKFIAKRRRDVGLTQMQLAESLGITDRAVSKWENGRAMPDTALMLDLCMLLKISVNDLLCGEVVTVDNYNEKTEQLLIELTKQKEETDKKLLSLEILIGIFSTIILFGFVFCAAFVPMWDWLRACLILTGFVIFLVGIAFALRIEQTAGYYKCAKCSHTYVPSYNSTLFAMHFCRTRYMRCPKCEKRSWQKKVISKE